MDESPLQTPHDHFVKAGLGVPEKMAALLRSSLPASLVEPIDWNSLQALPGSFLDEQLRHRQTDLLFAAKWRETPLRLYILFEHQRSPDRWMPLRLLRYMLRIWEDFQRSDPDTPKLPIILPIVFFQETRPWPISPLFADLIEMPETDEPWKAFVPDFRHEVLNLSELALDNLNHDLTVQVLLKVMRAILLPSPDESLHEGFQAVAKLAGAPDQTTFLRTCLTYLTNAGHSIDAERFLHQIKTIEDSRLKAEAMTIAEQLIKKGREEGRDEGLLSGERLILTRQLTRKFRPLPEWANRKLDEATPAQLEKWFESVLDARVLDDVFRD